MPIHAITSVRLGNTLLTNEFEKLTIRQPIDGHHRAELIVNSEFLEGPGNVFRKVAQYVGENMEISIRALSAGQGDELLFRGVITQAGVEKDTGSEQSRCVIEGMSPTYLLEDRPHIQSYEEKTLEHIVNEVLRHYPANFSKVIQLRNSENLAYTVQFKENSYRFLCRLCARFSQWFYYDGQNLQVGGREPGNISPLVYGVNLFRLRFQLKTAPAKAKLIAYDYQQDELLEEDITAYREDGGNEYTRHALEQSDVLYSKMPLRKISQALGSNSGRSLSDMARQLARDSSAGMAGMEGESDHPGLAPGREVSIDGQAYMITGTEHACTGTGEYQNTFRAVPAAAAFPRTDIDDYPEAEAQSAVVVDNNDPAGLGRVRVKFKWQSSGMSPWIRMISASGGGDKGFYMIPETGEEVIVDFEGGNPELPFVIGTTYNGKAKSSFGGAGNHVKALKTRSGTTVMLNDDDGSIELSDPSGGCIKMQGGKLTICAEDEIIFTTKKVNVGATENITMSEDKMVIDVTGNKINGKATDFTVEATNNSIKGKTKIEGDTDIQGNTGVEGENITIKGLVQMN